MPLVEEAGTSDIGADRGATAATGPDTANGIESATENGSEIGTAEHPAIETVIETEIETAFVLEGTTVGTEIVTATTIEIGTAAPDEIAVCHPAASDIAAGAAVGVEVDEEVHWVRKGAALRFHCLVFLFLSLLCVCAGLVFLNSLEGYGMVMLSGFFNKQKDKIP